MRNSLLILNFILIALPKAFVWAQACPGGIGAGMSCVAATSTADVTAHSTCRTVSNNHASGKAIMVPHSTSTQWEAFYNNPPSGVTAVACANIGYFVYGSTNYNGNMGGLTGADANCLSELQTNDWLGKSEAGTLTGARVKAFLCTSTTCNNLNSNTTYALASSGDAYVGGATFTTNASGQGPGHSSYLIFGAQSPYYYTGREAGGSATLWPTTPSVTHHCGDWTSMGTETRGYIGGGDEAGSNRWSYAAPYCNNAYPLICIVHPEP